MRRRSGTLLALVAVALLAGIGANATAQTSSDSSGGGPVSFGGFKLQSSGEGVTFTYNSPGLIPGTPSPLFAASLPESMTNMDSGPSGYALASLVYPGPLVADLPSVLALGGVPNANQIPSYPVRSQAFYPAGPTDASQDLGSGRETVSASEKTANAQTVYGAMQLPPMLNAGSVVSTSESNLEDSQVVTRTRVELSNVDIALGIVHMDSIVTDLVATSSGSDAATDGTTTVSGVKVLGHPATIDATGVHLQPEVLRDNPSSSSSSSSSSDPLAPITSAVQPAVDPLNKLLTDTVGSANEDINKLLSQAGISIQLLQPNEVKKGADASRLASGVLVTISYNGSTEPVLSNLLDLIPVEDLPSQGLGPIPFSSPQSLVLALKATHVETIGLAAGSVRAAASPPFTLPSVPASPLSSVSKTGAVNGFSTPTPSVGRGTAGNGSGGDAGPSIASTAPLAYVGGEPLAAVLSVLLLLMAGTAFWVGSGRLADNVLSTTSSSCPEGLDRA